MIQCKCRIGRGPATDLKLEKGLCRTNLIAARDLLEALNIPTENLENGREISAANRDNLKGTLRQKFRQFHGDDSGAHSHIEISHRRSNLAELWSGRIQVPRLV